MQLVLYEPEAIPRTTKAHSLLKVALTRGQVVSWVLFQRFELCDKWSHKTPSHSAHRTAAQHVLL